MENELEMAIARLMENGGVTGWDDESEEPVGDDYYEDDDEPDFEKLWEERNDYLTFLRGDDLDPMY